MRPNEAAPSGRVPGWGVIAATSLVVVVLFFLTARCFSPFAGGPAESEYYNLLVKGFRAGHLSVAKEVPPGLLKLANPYDAAANAVYRDQGILDLSYYRGAFYLYFGVGPAVLLFWPFVVVTGQYLSQVAAVFFFCTLGFGAGVLLLGLVWRRYFPEVRPAVLAVCVVAWGATAGLPLLLLRANIYEVAIACGQAMTLVALWCVWQAVHDVPHRLRWSALAGLSYGLAISARPSLAIGAVVLLLPSYLEWRARRRLPVRSGLAVIVPLGVVVAGLMIYNYERYENPLEFGQRYQLAGVNVRDAHQLFGPRYAEFNFRHYFFGPVRWSRVFPFVRASSELESEPDGLLGFENPYGVLANIPLVWLALAHWTRRRKRLDGDFLAEFLAAVGLMMVVNLAVVSMFAGTASRYQVDFMPPLVWIALVGLLRLEQATARSSAPQRFAWRAGWGALVIASIGFGLLVGVAPWSEYERELAGGGEGLRQQGRLREAAARLETVARLNPYNLAARNSLGRALLDAGRPAESLPHLQWACAHDQKFAAAQNNLGVALARLGRPDEARVHFQAALAVQPGLADARQNLERLNAGSGKIGP